MLVEMKGVMGVVMMAITCALFSRAAAGSQQAANG
jgi:hypothetical protein